MTLKAKISLILGAIGAAILAGLAIVTGFRKKADILEAVDAAKSGDVVQAAQQQNDAARDKMTQLAAQSAANSLDIQNHRSDLAEGKESADEIDAILRANHIIK